MSRHEHNVSRYGYSRHRAHSRVTLWSSDQRRHARRILRYTLKPRCLLTVEPLPVLAYIRSSAVVFFDYKNRSEQRLHERGSVTPRSLVNADRLRGRHGFTT